MNMRSVAGAAVLLLASPAFALNILVTNDDGLTSNVKALYDALKAQGHDVLVSVPCTGQSGRAGAIVMYSTTTIVADNDKSQVEAEGGCHNGAAATGAPAAGPFTKAGYTGGDFHYVHGTPVMATMYGLDVPGAARWGKAPDLVLSGPNEGQNIGKLVINSGTIGNAQFASGRGIPSIALSAGSDTVDNTSLANARSAIVAQQTVLLIEALKAKAGTGALLPTGLSLNVNFPTAVTSTTPFAFSRIGTYDLYTLQFKVSTSSTTGVTTYAYTGALATAPATAAQAEDESVVYQQKISVSAMQVGYDQRTAGQQWLRLRLRDLLSQ